MPKPKKRRCAMHRCGRFHGEQHPRARLSWAVVGVMRQARLDGWTVSAIARQFGVVRETVRDVVLMNTWTARDTRSFRAVDGEREVAGVESVLADLVLGQVQVVLHRDPGIAIAEHTGNELRALVLQCGVETYRRSLVTVANKNVPA